MGSIRRIFMVIGAIIVFLCALIMFIAPANVGYQLVLFILELALIVLGIETLFYYLLMARHMVGGLRIFFKSILMIDIGVFAITLFNLPKQYAILYILTMLLITGVMDILRALESKRFAGHWKIQFTFGMIEAFLWIICTFSMENDTLITVIFGLALIGKVVSMVVTAFRKTAIVYVN